MAEKVKRKKKELAAVIVIGGMVVGTALALLFGRKAEAAPPEEPQAMLHGIIYDIETGEPILQKAKVGIYGYQPWGNPYYLTEKEFHGEYTFTLPQGEYAVWCFVDEYEPLWVHNVHLFTDTKLDLGMTPRSILVL